MIEAEASAGVAIDPIPFGALAKRHVIAATVGNALEFYDFITYAFFAVQIGHAFFPGGEFARLMLSLATFGAGFLTRPIGGIVIGAYADRVGRAPAMVLSFTLMGLAIATLALIPSYATIGIAAPILAVTARLVQGFALGGDVGATTTYLLEAAAPEKRGVTVAWQSVSQNVAATIGALVGVVLSYSMSSANVDAYGWRIAFLIGAVTLPFGIMIRRSLPETLHRADPVAPAIPAHPQANVFRTHGRLILLSLLILGSGTIATYIFQYMSTFGQQTLHLSAGVSLTAEVVNNAIGAALGMAGGWLADRYGRRPAMIWPQLAFLLLIVPTFIWITTARDATALILGNVVLGLAGNLQWGAFYPALAESLPQRVRSRGFAIIYAVAIATFGGTTQPVVAWLSHATGSDLSIAWYLTGATAVGLVAMWLMPESAPVKIGRAEL